MNAWKIRACVSHGNGERERDVKPQNEYCIDFIAHALLLVYYQSEMFISVEPTSDKAILITALPCVVVVVADFLFFVCKHVVPDCRPSERVKKCRIFSHRNDFLSRINYTI